MLDTFTDDENTPSLEKQQTTYDYYSGFYVLSFCACIVIQKRLCGDSKCL